MFFFFTASIFKSSKGINKDDVIDNLSNLCPQKELDRLKHNTDLLVCLQIPLFLLMFKEQFEYNSDLPQNRGSILYNYDATLMIT